jgi:hypothetical protein
MLKISFTNKTDAHALKQEKDQHEMSRHQEMSWVRRAWGDGEGRTAAGSMAALASPPTTLLGQNLVPPPAWSDSRYSHKQNPGAQRKLYCVIPF